MENKRTRISAMLLVLALLLSVFGITAYAQEEAAPEAAVCYVPGDVNSDGSLDSRDAIYTLYASMGYENYSVSQDCDFDGDGEVQVKDAIWLLYASLDMRNHELPEEHHDYHDPIWNWDGETAALTLACGCGNVSEPIAAEVTAVETEATCTESGFITYTATAEGYTDVKVVYGDAVAGHEIGEPTCGEAAKCANCDFEIPASGHSYVKNESLSTAATCQAPAKEVWECSVCGDSKEINVGEPVKHQFEVTGNQELAIGQCQYAQDKTYTCIFGCGVTKTERTEVYTVHNYVRTTTAEPTCMAEGVTTYTCEGCGDTYTEAIPVASEHAWTYGSTAAICRHCGAEKAIVKMGSEGLAPEEITSSEIVLENNASVTLDDATLESIEQSLILEVEDVTDSFTNSTDKEIAAVYDLNMYVDGEQVSQFAGEITVSLPYTLQPGDDVNCIDIYYIDDNGNMTQMQGTYAGGYVTFTTSHFSYYTICITPYCERFGHQESAIEVEATCEEGGYHLVSCNICGMSYIHVEEGMGPKGHRYDELNIEGHCTEDIYYTQYCLECGAPNDIFVPAIGHNMILDEELSVAASCEASGKEVYYCDHIVNDPADPFLTTNCGYTYEVETARLSHEYESVELVQTCVSGGGTQYTCKHCGDTYIENATAPAGHAYKLLDMSWNETKTLVTASLGCENCDWTHTQQAVITRKITAPTCSAPGVITYTAKTVYNMIPFQISVDIPVEAIDHIPGGQLQSNAGQHYYSCIMCGEPVGGQNHSWGETSVVTEPTCVDAGSGTQACTVCGYEKDITIPATGEHSYKDGKCTVCGFQEGSCSHVRTYETPIDLAEMGGCEGTIHVESCECGYQTNAWWDVSCNLVHDEEPLYVEDQYGFGYFVHISRCADCGLTIEYAEYATDYDPDTCTGWNKMIYKITLGDTVLVDGQWHDALTQALSGRVHPTRPTGNTVDLREYGLCSEILVEYACPCDAHVTAYYAEESSCQWVCDEENSTDALGIYNCRNCGAVRHVAEEYTHDNENCLDVYTYTYTYFVDGEQVYEYDYSSYIIQHNYQLDRYELYGDSCTDGISTWYSCENCGVTRESYTTYHPLIHKEVTELSGVCYETAVQMTCPCEEQKTGYRFQGENWCSFYPNHYDAMTETWTYDCDNCGAILTEQTEFFGKDENCMVYYRITATLSDKDGNLLFTGTQDMESEEHNSEYTYELLGNSCQDGVNISQICKDCGYGYSYTIYNHEVHRVAEYDMSAFGFCSSHIYLSRCPCGEEIGLPGMWNCRWNWVNEGENEDGSHYVKWYCPNCQTYRTDTTVYGTGINACQTRITTTHTFEKEGVEPFSFTFDAIENNHKYIYELTLRQEGTTCHEGYHVYGVCQVCGAVDEWDGWAEGHPSFEIAREIVTENLPEGQKLCGDLEVITWACPCGQETSQNFEWIGGECQWDDGYYDEELGRWVDICVNCGAQWYVLSSFTPAEGESCLGIRSQAHIFRRNGAELFRFDEQRETYNHDAVYNLQLIGDTCDEGYRILGTCLTCGADIDNGIWYGCDNNAYVTDLQIIENEAICGGGLRIETSGCACTPNKNTWLNHNCSFSWYKDEKTDTEYEMCDFCDLEIHYTYGEPEAIEGEPCYTLVPTQMTFILKGDTLGVMDIVERWGNHSCVYDFDLLGDSCEDGYYVTERCTNCDYTNTWENYGHDWDWEYLYMPEGTCGGYVQYYSCPCGEYSGAHDYTSCNFQYVDGEDYTEIRDGLEWYCENYVCPECSLSYVRASCYVYEGNCQAVQYWAYSYYYKGEFLGEYQYGEAITDHRLSYASQLLEGSVTCSDGILVESFCECGHTYNSEVYNYCPNIYTTGSNLVDTIDLAQYGACDGYIEVYECPCGLMNYTQKHTSCTWEVVETTSDRENWIFYNKLTCTECGLTMEETITNEWKDRCYCDEMVNLKISMNGAEIATFDQRYSRAYVHENSDWEYVMYGDDCTAGVDVTQSCRDCGHVESWHTTEHSSDYVGISCCNGYFGLRSTCTVCGYNEVTDPVSQLGCTFNYAEGGYGTGVNGNEAWLDTYVCSECGLIYVRESSTEYLGDCQEIQHTYYTFTCDGYEEGPLHIAHMYENHRINTSASLLEGSATCADGVLVERSCECGQTTSSQIQYNHEKFENGTIALPEDSCGGNLRVLSCACGEEDWYFFESFCAMELVADQTYSETLEDGSTHSCLTTACSLCGMTVTTDTYTVSLADCGYMSDEISTYTFNGNVFTTTNSHYTYKIHGESVTSYELVTPGTTCEDGFYEIYTCVDCGEVTGTGSPEYYHITYEVSDSYIEFTPYTGIGRGVSQNTCPCGCSQSINWYGGSHTPQVIRSWTDTVDGAAHSYTEYQCADCMITYIVDTYSETHESGKVITCEKYDFYYDGTHIVTLYQKY